MIKVYVNHRQSIWILCGFQQLPDHIHSSCDELYYLLENLGQLEENLLHTSKSLIYQITSLKNIKSEVSSEKSSSGILDQMPLEKILS